MTLTMGEGDTPLVALPRLAEKWGLRALYAKAEYLNPTGSYKDRIAAATMDEALRLGRRGWIGTSSGFIICKLFSRSNVPGSAALPPATPGLARFVQGCGCSKLTVLLRGWCLADYLRLGHGRDLRRFDRPISAQVDSSGRAEG